MKTLFIFLSILFLQFSIYEEAKASTKNVDTSFFDPELFSLAKKTQSAFDSASSVYVLSSEDIRRSGVTSIPEALRMVPGVQVARMHGNAWAISSRGLNHQYASKLLVLIDGLTIYTPIFSGAFWDNHDYVIDDIDRIEVIRGPGGSIWGANAVNGIINIITKNSAQTQGTYFSQILGNDDNSITEIRYGGKTEDLNTFRVYAKRALRGPLDRLNDGSRNVDATFNNSSGSNFDGISSSRGGFRYDITSVKDNTMKIAGDFFKTESRNHFQNLNAVDGATHKVNEGGNILVNWDKTISKKSRTTLQSYVYLDRNNFTVGIHKQMTLDVDFQHFYDFSDRNRFSWGLGYKNLIDKIQSKSAIDDQGREFIPLNYNPTQRNIEVLSAFIQDEYSIIPNDLFLTIGSKFEHNEQTGFEYQPSVRLKYFPDRNQTLWAGVSRAIRVPTRGEDNIEIRANADTVVTRGNTEAESESVVSYEFGYRIKPNNKTLADISVFFNEYDSLGNFDADMTNATNLVAGGPSGTPTASNTGRAKSYGLEFTGKWQATNSLRFEVGYDFLKVDIDLDASSNESDDVASALNADRLIFFENMSPQNQFRFRSFYNITPKIEFDNILYYVDQLKGRSASGIVENDIPSYVRWDTRLGYLASTNFNLSVGVQNILDDKHTEFTPGLFNNRVEVGRTFYGKLALHF